MSNELTDQQPCRRSGTTTANFCFKPHGHLQRDFKAEGATRIELTLSMLPCNIIIHPASVARSLFATCFCQVMHRTCVTGAACTCAHGCQDKKLEAAAVHCDELRSGRQPCLWQSSVVGAPWPQSSLHSAYSRFAKQSSGT